MKTPVCFAPLGYAPNHSINWSKTTTGRVPHHAFEVGEATYSDGTKRRVTRATFNAECDLAKQQEAARQTVGKVLAGYSEQHGAFIGVIKSVSKNHRTLVTRGGARIKVPLIGLEEFTYAQWDETLERAKVECPALGMGLPKFTL